MPIQVIQGQGSPLAQLLSGVAGGTEAFIGAREKKREKGVQSQQARDVARILGIEDPGSATAEQITKAVEVKGKAQPDVISPQATQLIERSQRGERISANDMQGLSEKEVRTILRSQEVAGVTGAEKEKAFLNKNLKRYDELSTEAIAERGVMRTLDEMQHLVETGATDNIISNFITKFELDLFKPFLQTPGSKAYMTGFKALFNDFKATFGARPTVYEAKIYESGLPELLSPNDAKMASIFELKAIKQAKVIESEAYNQAYDELGFKASPIAVEKRANEIAEVGKDELYADFRAKIDELTGGIVSRGPTIEEGKLKKVPAGTPLNEESAKVILEKAKGDPVKATKMARGLGYDI